MAIIPASLNIYHFPAPFTTTKKYANNLESRFDNLDAKVDSLTDRISRLEKSLNDFKQETKRNFKFFFDHICRLEDDIEDIRQKVEASKKEKNDPEKVKVLEQRIVKLEKDLAKHKALHNFKANC